MNWMVQNQFFLLIGLMAAGFALTGWFLRDMRKKVQRIFGVSDGTGPDLQHDLIRRLAHIEAKIEEMEPRLNITEGIAAMSIQKVGFLRFNPFQDMGGDNSFILVLLDHGNNGMVLSSLYMRDGARLYAKQVTAGNPLQPLSKEEEKVLQEAINKS